MDYKNIIEMDIWSKFGCFTKPFSNSGGLLTYLIPPKTSIIGMVGAILGYDFEDFETTENDLKKYSIEKLNDIKISVQPLFPFKVKRVVFNNLVADKKIINIKQDVLFNPYYKLFISFPEQLNEEKEVFEERIKTHKSVYNLYMGRNEFFLNYEYCKSFENPKKYSLTNENKNKFFNESYEIHGSLNRENIQNTALSKKINTTRNLFSVDNSYDLESYYEYLISDYPIKREQFAEFTYSPISFYTRDKNEQCYFSDITLKSKESLELFNIGGKKWISLI